MVPLVNTEIIGLTTLHVWITVVFHVTCYHMSLLEKGVWAAQRRRRRWRAFRDVGWCLTYHLRPAQLFYLPRHGSASASVNYKINKSNIKNRAFHTVNSDEHSTTRTMKAVDITSRKLGPGKYPRNDF